MRRKPLGGNSVSGRAHFLSDVFEVEPDKVRQHESVVQVGAPACEGGLVGFLPEAGDERSQEQLLCQAHARVGRHLEGAQFNQALPA